MINKIVRIFLILFTLTLLFIACEEDQDKPDDLIEEPVYVDVLTEVFLIRSYSELSNFDEEQEDSLYSVIFDHYEVDRDQFERSHAYYQRQGEIHLARTDSIRNILRDEREALMRARRDEHEE